MLQKQVPVWVSHFPGDPHQAEDGRPPAACTLEVREQGWVGGPGAEGGDGLREGWEHCKDMKQFSSGSLCLETWSGPLGTGLLGGWPGCGYPLA